MPAEVVDPDFQGRARPQAAGGADVGQRALLQGEPDAAAVASPLPRISALGLAPCRGDGVGVDGDRRPIVGGPGAGLSSGS